VNVWKCPSHQGFSKSYYGLSYGYNIRGFFNTKRARLDRLREPSRDVLLTDSQRGPDGWSAVVSSPVSDTNKHLCYRHNGGMNILWADGHVDWHSQSQVVNENSGTWNNPPDGLGGWYGCQKWFRDPAYPDN